MRDASAMRRVHGIGQLNGERECPIERHRSFEWCALHEFHHQVVRPDVVKLADVVVGAIVAAGGQYGRVSTILGFVAVVCAATNVTAGFLITDRMLAMFKGQLKTPPGKDAAKTEHGK